MHGRILEAAGVTLGWLAAVGERLAGLLDSMLVGG